LPEVIEVGLTVQLAPLGHPLTVRFTVCGLPAGDRSRDGASFRSSSG